MRTQGEKLNEENWREIFVSLAAPGNAANLLMKIFIFEIDLSFLKEFSFGIYLCSFLKL